MSSDLFLFSLVLFQLVMSRMPGVTKIPTVYSLLVGGRGEGALRLFIFREACSDSHTYSMAPHSIQATLQGLPT